MTATLPRFMWRQRALAGNPDTPAETLERLAVEAQKDGADRVRAALAGNPRAPEEVLAVLAHHPDPRVRAEVAANPTTPIPAVCVLAQDPDPTVSTTAQRHNRIAAGLTPARATARRGQEPDTAEKALAALLADGGRSLANSGPVFRNLPFPAEVLAVLAHAPDRDVQREVARHPHTDPGTLAFLANFADGTICRAVAANPHTGPSTLAALAVVFDHAVPRRAGWAATTTPKRHVAVTMAEWMGLAATVAENPSAPAETLARLAQDSSAVVRCAVAENRATPVEVLADLAGDPDPNVVTRVALNRTTSPSTLAALTEWRPAPTARPGDADPRSPVARNPNTPPAALRALARLGFNGYVAANPSSPSDLLAEIAQVAVGEDAYGTQLALAGNPHTPPAVLAALADHYDAHLRRSVASNPNTPVQTLQAIARDDFTEVWQAALDTLEDRDRHRD